jgi:hypothetical protein
MTDKKTTLKQKLVKVSESIGYLQKDKQNKMQGYSYLSEAKIKETITSKFAEQGIVFNYSTTEVREYEISPTSKGTKQFCTVAQGSYSFMDVESEELISGTWAGTGTDTGDKGLYKAITGGIKYVLNTNFLIPTGDDPENDSDGNGNGKAKVTPKVNPDTELKKALMKKHNGDKEKAEAEYLQIKFEEQEKVNV